MAETIYKKTRNEQGMTRDEVCNRAMLLNNPIQYCNWYGCYFYPYERQGCLSYK